MAPLAITDDDIDQRGIVKSCGSSALARSRGDLLNVVRTLDQHPLVEACPGAYEGDQVRTVDRPPAILRCFKELEGHGEPGGPAARSLGHAGPQPDRGEGRLDWVAGLEVHPVLGWEVEEAQQLLGVVDDLGHRLGPLGAVVAGERLDRPLSMVAVGRIPDSARALRAPACTAAGRQPSTLASLWTQSRCWRVAGKTSRRAAHNPRAPSPTATTGARIPRRRRSRSSSAHDSVDSRSPSETATSSLVPSARTPTITNQHRWACSKRTRKWSPSAQRYT